MRPPAYRLGSTSYVYRAGLVENASRLANWVRDVELVLFELPDGSGNVPDAATVAQLAEIGRVHDLTYTVHLPRDLRAPPHPSIDAARRIVAACEPLQPHAYVFHLDGAGAGTLDWTAQAIEAARALVAMVPGPRCLSLENLENYLPEYLLPIFDAVPLSRALDIGHLWKAGRDPAPFIETWLEHARVVHLHGFQGSDHLPLAVMSAARLDPILERLNNWDGVLTLEVFEDDFFMSYAAWATAIQRLHSRAGA
ncbi:MAG: sugar phosphate isomerase/epimerase [Chloroflexi bacterium]|nr:sugar phosphate isomerase/epimerase [Chloroflexota bacterium]